MFPDPRRGLGDLPLAGEPAYRGRSRVAVPCSGIGPKQQDEADEERIELRTVTSYTSMSKARTPIDHGDLSVVDLGKKVGTCSNISSRVSVRRNSTVRDRVAPVPSRPENHLDRRTAFRFRGGPDERRTWPGLAGQGARALMGRVRFSPAVLRPDHPPDWFDVRLSEDQRILKILSSPKPPRPNFYFE